VFGPGTARCGAAKNSLVSTGSEFSRPPEKSKALGRTNSEPKRSCLKSRSINGDALKRATSDQDTIIEENKRP
jgi:hypothetical protein